MSKVTQDHGVDLLCLDTRIEILGHLEAKIMEFYFFDIRHFENPK